VTETCRSVGNGDRERPGIRAGDEHTPQAQEIGIIPVDAAFSPVVAFRYEVEETRVGQKTNYDKLTIEIWTNGSVSPEMALVEAAKILRKHLNPSCSTANSVRWSTAKPAPPDR